VSNHPYPSRNANMDRTYCRSKCSSDAQNRRNEDGGIMTDSAQSRRDTYEPAGMSRVAYTPRPDRFPYVEVRTSNDSCL
jgi:hypothetical protein